MYADASFGDDPINGRSVTGLVLMLNGGAIMWRSSQQKFVATCTAASELGALSTGVDELIDANCQYVAGVEIESVYATVTLWR